MLLPHGVTHAMHRLSLCQARILLLWKHEAGLTIRVVQQDSLAAEVL